MYGKLIVVVSLLLLVVGSVQAADIHEAADAGDVETIQSILAEHPELVNAPDTAGRFDTKGSLPIHLATLNGHLEAVKLLIANGADVNAGDGDNSTPIFCAGYRGYLDILNTLVDHGATIEVRDNLNVTPLLASAWGGNLDMVRFLGEKGASFDVRDNRGYTPLLASARSGNPELVEYLLDKGVDINAQNNGGISAVYMAASGDHAEVLDLLEKRGANLNAADNDGTSPLAAAVHGARVDAVKKLLELGAEVNILDNHGYTPLCHAMVRWVPTELVHLLIEHGAEVNALTDSSAAPIVVASEQGTNEQARTLEKVRALISSGAEVDFTNQREDQTPLVIAASRGNDELAGIILNEGADAGMTDPRYGRTPLHWSAIRGKSGLASLLLAHGADIEARDKAGKSTLYYATRYGNTSTADVLKAAGARTLGTEESYGPSTLVGQNLGDKEAAIWYLGISGWGIKTRNHFLIFDYAEMGAMPDEPCLANGHIDPREIKDLNVAVFSSHEHSDHYDTTIFGWQEQIPNITYVLGHRPEGRTGYEYIAPRTDKAIGDLHVWTIPATDAGVGYLIEVDGLFIFHAGDHANGEVGLHAPYTDQIDYLASLGNEVDLAFLPISGCGMGTPESIKEGVYYALQKLTPRVFSPQHMLFSTYAYREFVDEAREKGVLIPIICAENGGDCYLYKNGGVM